MMSEQGFHPASNACGPALYPDPCCLLLAAPPLPSLTTPLMSALLSPSAHSLRAATGMDGYLRCAGSMLSVIIALLITSTAAAAVVGREDGR